MLPALFIEGGDTKKAGGKNCFQNVPSFRGGDIIR